MRERDSTRSGPLLQRLVAVLLRPLATVVYRPVVAGAERLPRHGGYVVCPNHLSGFDVLAVAYAAWPRPVRSMGKIQLFRWWPLGLLLRALGVFPARDEHRLGGGVTSAVRLARTGSVVLIFPEGARRRGVIRRPRSGAAHVALAAGVPVVPVALRGTDGWRRCERWRVAVGAPLWADATDGARDGAAARDLTRRLWEEVAALERTLAGGE